MKGHKLQRVLFLIFFVISLLFETNRLSIFTSELFVLANVPSTIILAKESSGVFSGFPGVTQTVDLPNFDLAPLERPASLWETSAYLSDDFESNGISLDADLLPEPLESSSVGRSYSKFLRFVSVKRSVKIQKNYVTVNVDLKLKNILTPNSEYSKEERLKADGSIPSFHLMFPAHEAVQLGTLVVKSLSSTSRLQIFSDAPTRMNETVFQSALSPTRYRVELETPLKPQEILSLEVSYTLGRPFLPLPEKIEILEKQSVEFLFYSIWLSPYGADEETTTIELFQGALVSRPSFQKITAKGLKALPDKSWTTGTFYDVKANTVGKALKFHFDHEHPLPYFVAIEKKLEVSYWGNVYCHEDYYLHNEAAGLEKEFSRYDYWKKTNDVQHANLRLQPSSFVNHLYAYFPSHIRNFEYYDTLGNISTSKMFEQKTARRYSFKMIPRFPVLGGWNIFWQFQYNLRAEVALKKQTTSQSTVLKVPFYPGFLDIYAEDYYFDVVLPHGAHNIRVDLPVEIDYKKSSTIWGWYDIFQSRPVLHFYKNGMFIPSSDVLKAHIRITYDTSWGTFWQPFTLILLFLIPLVIYLCMDRITLRICTAKESQQLDAQLERKILIRELLEQLENLMHNYSDYSDLMACSNSMPKAAVEILIAKWHGKGAAIKMNIENHINSQTDESIAPLKHLIPLAKGLIEIMEDLVLREKLLAQATSVNEKKKLLDQIASYEARFVTIDKQITSTFLSFKSDIL